MDRVPAPSPDWFDCSSIFLPGDECATVDLPLDYDQPSGPTTSVAVLRHRSANQKRKIGSLFLNPGGPGGSGVTMAALAPFFLASDVLERFDIVGFDPRGTNFSHNVRCWRNAGEQAAALAGLGLAFPWTAAEERAAIKSAMAFGVACSTTGAPLAGSMSTAQVARDMDVLRRAVGDQQLSYLGFSYGSHLGDVYANLFPDRFRAIAIDGVLDPLAWAGTAATRNIPVSARLKSGEGAAAALHEILRRCRKAGEQYCAFAAAGDPERNYARIVAALKRSPLVIRDPDTGEELFTLTYATLIGFLLGDLTFPDGATFVDLDLTSVLELLGRPARRGTPQFTRQANARAALVAKARALHAKAEQAEANRSKQGSAFGYGFPYDNFPEAFSSVMCTDGVNPASAGRWPAYADQANRRAPDFGRLWTWASVPCASNTWTIRDEDAYAGPFTRRTASPVLVVGNYWDPSTNYDGAVTVASLQPNSRLLSSDSWGHTAYGTSDCVTATVSRYLIAQRLPARGTVCRGDTQPFTEPLPLPGAPGARSAAPERRGLPPVVPPVPGALPR